MPLTNPKGKTITSPKTKKGGGGVKMIPICKVDWYLYWWTVRVRRTSTW